MADHVLNLKKICEQLGEDEPEMDKNFWAVNMHGDELKEEFVIPQGVRIVMFCYSGRKLNICPRFDKFNWREIFLNENASYNYCTFLANISQYSSIRDHFCVYEAGDSVRDLKFTPDEWFRSGIYQLPVYSAVHDPETDEVYVSSPEIFDKVVAKSSQIRRISVDRNKTAKIIKDKDSMAIFFTKQLEYPNIKLSDLVRKMRTKVGRVEPQGFTLLLLTCRTGEERTDLLHPPTVYDKLGELLKKYDR